jgi:hypothetical protein
MNSDLLLFKTFNRLVEEIDINYKSKEITEQRLLTLKHWIKTKIEQDLNNLGVIIPNQLNDEALQLAKDLSENCEETIYKLVRISFRENFDVVKPIQMILSVTAELDILTDEPCRNVSKSIMFIL